ncbi:hypothetical protein K438DRAFT_1752589 [Mycena galopus ATCC 62051]|nr:hypothetical protein K438DRAFT_1752589 [Mycena galopus ATCC 62051]
MCPDKATNDATPNTPQAHVVSIREIIAVARGQKKHPTANGYALINASLDLLNTMLEAGNFLATALSSFKTNLVADLLAATSRASTLYAATARAFPNPSPPPAPIPPKSPLAVKPNELVISLDKTTNELLACLLPEIKNKVETAAASTGAEKLKGIKLKGVKILPRDRLLIAADSEKTATLLKQSAPHWVPRLAKKSHLVVPKCEIVNTIPQLP